MKTSKTIDILNELLDANNHRLDGYEKALNDAVEHDFKALLARFARTSHKNGQELAYEILRLGGTPAKSTKTSGMFYRVWMDVKAAFAGKDREAILRSSKVDEDSALETYKDILNEDLDYLSADQQTLVRVQYSLLKADHMIIQSLRKGFLDRQQSKKKQKSDVSF
jgi:uncharacterized protein (TIGR02284 family)